MRSDEFLTELFTQPRPWNWVHVNPQLMSAVATWKTTEGTTRSLESSFIRAKKSPSVWMHAFEVDGSSKLTGTGDAFGVLATELAIMKSFIAQVTPDYLAFTASQAEPSRVRLYDSLIQKLSRDKYQDISADKNQWPMSNFSEYPDVKTYVLKRQKHESN